MVQQHLPVPCHDHNYLEPDNPDHTWTLYENGTLLRHFDSALLPKQDYCLQPRKFQDLYKLVPHHCLKPPDHTNAYMQSVSIFFLLMVIIVYLILPNFKGDYFKCSICYFSCLTLSFILIVIVRFQWIEPHQKVLCQLTGYIGYYFTISTFLWLLIINYDLWKAFNTIVITRRTRYLNYHIFVWGLAHTIVSRLADNSTGPNRPLCLAALQLLVTYIVALVVNIDSKWAPNIGTYACWIDTTAWSARIYYYGPIGIYLTLSTTLFIKTASEIFVQNRKNRLQLINSESQRSLRSLTNFAMFLRLFIIMGVLWILEVISYFGEFNHIGTTILDIFNCNQGIILFVATILKKDVLKSLANRVGIGEQISQSGPSTTSP
ncbi:probable G-protein coupled receptor Mth-like 11 [Drosophila sulfurigaster albostrigata]|uniref:probable G-protein coupled receptor Mth-like 11 n=1 Tax=Drosophila sulfurigaster albostrigata TaxID=89887 RepID=UPI002D21BCA2|nr:probable G-protein coupled receptor Mth-like 11 [Drosophila sulfurigaster albostrigata]